MTVKKQVILFAKKQESKHLENDSEKRNIFKLIY